MERKWVKFKVFLTRFRLLFAVCLSVSQKNPVMSRIERSYVKFVVEFKKKSQILLHMQLKRKIVKFVKFVPAFDPGHKWKNWRHGPKVKSRLSFPGPFLLRPSPSQVKLGFRRPGKVAEVLGNGAQVGQIQSFPNPPLAPC